MTPGDALRIRRENAGLPQNALGKKIGSNRRNISAMERSKRPIGAAIAERLPPCSATGKGPTIAPETTGAMVGIRNDGQLYE